MITVKVDPNSPGLKLVDEMAQKMKRMGPLMKKIATLMLSIVRGIFRPEEGLPGHPEKAHKNIGFSGKRGD